MITNDQVNVLRELLANSERGQTMFRDNAMKGVFQREADALAAAIATIEGLPCDDNGVRLLPGPIVRVMMRAAAKGVAGE